MNPLLKLFNDLINNGFEYFGRYYSSYRGFVVDNQDPDKFGRLKLQIPQVSGTQNMNYWAWPKGQFSGNGYGIQCIPKNGDMVWVEFELGDPRKPIWTYGHFSNDANDTTPEKPTELSDIGNFWFKTPEGHLIEFDDTKKLIRVTNKKGYYIEMNETAISLAADKISLTKLDESDEPAVLGDKNEDVLNDLQDSMNDLTQLLLSIGSTDSAVATGLGLTYGARLVSELPTIISQIQSIQTKISQTKSTKVTLS